MLSQDYAVRELGEVAELLMEVLKGLCVGVLGFLLRHIGFRCNTPALGLEPSPG